MNVAAHPPLRTPTLEGRFQEAVAFSRNGGFGEERRCFENLLTARYRSLDCLCALGLIGLQQGDFAGASSFFRRALKLDKRAADAQHHLAAALTGLGQYAEAAERYEKALSLRPRFAEAHNNYGYLLQLLGRHQQA